MASWLAQYMGEPIERAGALFEPQDMRYYNGDASGGDPYPRLMAVDPAFGGGDLPVPRSASNMQMEVFM